MLGVAGIAGNGQRELMEVPTGEVLVDRAEAITIDDTPIGRLARSSGAVSVSVWCRKNVSVTVPYRICRCGKTGSCPRPPGWS